ncbi:MAG: phosphoribosylpyrophosphate synthetase [Saprospiraceae bacterium]
MQSNYYDTLVEATQELKSRGYKDDFKLRDEGMENLANNKFYQPDDLKIVEFHRFEGMTNPAESSMISAVELSDGRKGTIVTTYGAYSDEKMDEFLKEVEIEEEAY